MLRANDLTKSIPLYIRHFCIITCVLSALVYVIGSKNTLSESANLFERFNGSIFSYATTK